MIRLFAVVAALSSIFASLAAETVKINGREAHPSRVLVKYRAVPDRAALAAEAAAPKVDVKRKFSHIPRLATVEFKDKAALKAAAAANPDPAASLQETIRQMQASGLFEYVEPDY